MPTEARKGITVKIDAELHAQVKTYIEANSLTMAEFVTRALDNELHPKQQIGGDTMENMKTLAFQVPESLFQQIKDYLHRNHMTQKQFVIGLIEAELNRDLEQRQESAETQDISSEQDEPGENVQDDFASDEDADLDESESNDIDEDESEETDFSAAETENDDIDDAVESDDEEIDESEDEDLGMNM